MIIVIMVLKIGWQMGEIFSDSDKKKVIQRYTERLQKFGYSQKAVGWGEKGKQENRFEVLTSYWNLKNKKILDIGAGFGDLYNYVKPFEIKEYCGLELVPALIEKGNEIYGREKKFRLINADILDFGFQEKFDIVFISGMFNFKLINGNNYEFIENVLSKSFEISNEGVCSNFITDRVDYHEELIFNSRPEKILEIALKQTKSVCLKNDYFPFEFSIFLNKDDSFSEKKIFNKYLN